MEDELVSYVTAIVAKDAGFNEHTYAYMKDDVLYDTTTDGDDWTHYAGSLRIPTQSLLQKWLREEHKIDIIITSNLLGYGYMIYNRYPPTTISSKVVTKTYEEALETALIEVLTGINSNQIVTPHRKKDESTTKC